MTRDIILTALINADGSMTLNLLELILFQYEVLKYKPVQQHAVLQAEQNSLVYLNFSPHVSDFVIIKRSVKIMTALRLGTQRLECVQIYILAL
jgi:hypothetical protein